MIDLGLMKYFLCIEVTQSKCAKDVLKIFRLINYSPISTPVIVGIKLNREDTEKGFNSNIFKRLVGSFMYAITYRPDIMNGVSLIS